MNLLCAFHLRALTRWVVIFAATVLFTTELLGATFTVNSTSDNSDVSPGNGLCATSGGVCTLRAAIQEANALAGTDTINFSIAGTGTHTIAPGSPLPTITGPVTIDATTDDSFAANGNKPAIVLSGANAGWWDTGLVLSSTADGSTIRGLVIRDWGGDGIEIQANSTGNTIAGNYIGRLNPNGTASSSGTQNSYQGIWVVGSGNVIGGLSEADRNVISGNGESGILIENASASGNLVIGNFIGTDANGTSDLGNSLAGVLISNASNNTVGGSVAGANNLISGNGEAGVEITGSGSTGNTVLGNRIGLDTSGAATLGNSWAGVWLNSGAASNIIGGTERGAGNVIAGNAADGVELRNDAGSNNAILGNSIYSNSESGIDLIDNGVTTNDAGDSDSGPNGLQNYPALTSANSNATGTTIVGSLNSNANTMFRIEFFANRPFIADASNGEGERYLGFVSVTTNGSGNATINATLSNVWVNSGDKITATATVDLGAGSYGSTSEFAANVTATSTGIIVVDTTSDVADGTTTSITALGNARGADGRISLREAITAANNTSNGATPDKIVFNIDGQSPYTINLGSALPTLSTSMIIDAQTQPGWTSAPIIELNCASASSTGITITGGGSTVKGFIINRLNFWYGINITTNGGNTIAGNYIGIDYNGVSVSSPAAYTGIQIDGTSGNIIGGTTASDRNVIGGYMFDAVLITGAGATGNFVRGNYLGVNAPGTGSIGGYTGVRTASSAAGNTIGGTSASERNVISGNSVAAVQFDTGGNTLRGNYIGLNAAGTGFIANYEGVIIASNNNTIGGLATGAGNIIAGNSRRGVKVTSGTGNAILGNSIYFNGNLAIDLGSTDVNPNNGTKNAGLPNYDIDFPVFTYAKVNATGTGMVVGGYVGSAPNQSTFANARVEVFKSDNDSTGYGEGKTYIGYLTTDGNGNFYGSLAVPSGSFTQITGTATDTSNNTSEFGPNMPVIVTAVKLLDFSARGDGTGVKVSWQTAQEARNKGFDVYRAASPFGEFVKLNQGLIPSTSVSGEGRSYSFLDTTGVRGRLYYYKLKDVDAGGTHTPHGPVCVDWDADGVPDDWEIAHGLNPTRNDAGEDPDGDGVVNRREYERGTDPHRRDTNGNGVPDGQEKKSAGGHGAGGGLGALRGVTVVSSEATGMTLELETPAFDTTVVDEGGEAFERLRVAAYVHGYAGEPGRPQLPVKGLLIDVPEGKRAKLTVLSVSAQRFPGYRLYPTPAHAPAGNELLEVFTLDGPAYGRTGFEPGEAAELSIGYLAHGGVRQRLVFYPFGFNPATGELLQRERIRVRVDFVADAAGQPALARVPAAALSAVAGGGWTPGHRHAAYKITTAAEGIYRITRDWLMAQGIGAVEADGIDLAQVRLYHLGVEQAIEVADANGNSRLDAGDFVGFYAAPVPEAYRKFTRYNCYWLISGGGAGALRMAQVAGAPAGGGLAASHAGTVHHELDQLYLQSAQGADALDRWIFSTIAVGPGFADPQAGLPKNFNFSLPGALGSGDLTVRLYSPYDLDHAVTISVNGVEAGTVAWSGIGFGEATFADVAFNPGANTVSILCAGATDKAGLDWVQTHYARSFAASADSLKFSHTVGYRYLLTGFTGSEIGLYDITDPAAVSRVVGGTISGSGPYSLEVEPTVTVGNRTYLAVASAAIPTPAAAVEDTASSLREPAEGADWILITSTALGWDGSGDLNGWVEELVTLRRAQGLRCAVVDVTDIFDEFGYGFATPAAIRAFLSHAYANWPRPAPRYVLIVGDATYDFKNNWNLSPAPVNHVPAWLIATTYLGETATDERYVQFSADGGLAQMAIGRLPAATLTQAEAMAAKIVSYETAANTKSWQRRVVLAADNRIDDWEAVFETMGEDAAALLPAGMESPQRFYLAEYENEQLAATDLTADLLPAINAGALIVYYSGHGSLNLWATERMIDNRGGAYRDDVDSLSNTGRYPFVVNMACLSGYFLYPFAGTSWQSLAEGFMRAAEAGAVAALMPTAMTAADGQQVLSNALFEALFAEDQRRLGDALGAARQALLANSGVATQETADTFMLFGDPATVLQVPLPRRPSGLSAARQGAVVMLSWQPALDADGAPVAGYHIYRRAAGETSFRRLTQAPLNALAFTDTPATGLAAQGSWQYALTSVDGDGLESVLSQVAALTPNPDQENEPLQSATGSGSGGGCFVSVATAGASSCGPAAAILTALMALPTALCALRPTTRKFRRIRSGRRVRRSGKSKRLSIFRHCFFDLERPTVLPDKNIGKG